MTDEAATRLSPIAGAGRGKGTSDAVLTPPPSKSDALRALVLSDATGVPLALPEAEALPRDVDVLRAGLLALRQPTADVDCRDGGAPFRFLLAQAAVLPSRTVRFRGTPRLGERPHRPLLDALRAALGPHGLTVTEGAPWPLTVASPAHPERATAFAVTGAESSQFASALLLAAARLTAADGLARDVRVDGALASEGYLAMTARWLAAFGFGVEVLGGHTRVTGWRRPTSVPSIPGDWSSLTVLLPLAWRTGARVARVALGTGHPDEAVLAHLASVGLALVPDGDAHRVTGTLRGGLEVDVSRCPDAAPALVALACALPAPSRFTHAGVLRHKESDRLAALADLARAAGGDARVDGDVLTITPAHIARDFAFEARDDHRLAMAAATVAALLSVRVRLAGREAVAKSFPGFWAEVARAGLQVETAP
ncbi:MAG: 3-phosphoshikimate 1-carboxyvinyltransferase [Myxococcota bacterium]